MSRLSGLCLAGIICLLALSQSGTEGQVGQIKLWAAIIVSEPIFEERRTENLQMNFGVVNDGPSTVDPEIASSHLFINGVEPSDWYLVMSNGPRTSDFNALRPGHSLRFGYALGKYFPKPGIYTVRWEGRHFKAAAITMRVLPANR